MVSGSIRASREAGVDRVDCDTYRIEAADPYSADYEGTVARNVREQEQDALLALRIASPLPHVSHYDTVILACPIWNVRPPMILSTFVESIPLVGKRVLPATTHAMSGLGRAVDIYTELAVGASIGEGLAVRAEEVADEASAIELWLRGVAPESSRSFLPLTACCCRSVAACSPLPRDAGEGCAG